VTQVLSISLSQMSNIMLCIDNLILTIQNSPLSSLVGAR